MNTYRLSYPAHIYVSIKAATEHDAKQQFTELLDNMMEGVIIHHLDDQRFFGERLYPVSDGNSGAVLIQQIAVEDVVRNAEKPIT